MLRRQREARERRERREQDEARLHTTVVKEGDWRDDEESCCDVHARWRICEIGRDVRNLRYSQSECLGV